MRNLDQKKRIVTDVATELEIAPELIFRLLALQDKHRDLQAWGARPNLRRDIIAIIDDALPSNQATSPE